MVHSIGQLQTHSEFETGTYVICQSKVIPVIVDHKMNGSIACLPSLALVLVGSSVTNHLGDRYVTPL